MDNEIWRDIPDAGGRFVRYQVSDKGNMRSVRLVEGEPAYTKPMKVYVEEKSGVKARKITLRKDCKKGNRSYNVSQLVADAFIPNPQGYKFLKHINGDVLDDRVENLRRVSNPLLYYEYTIRQGDKIVAAGVRGCSARHAIIRWHSILSLVLDFTKTFDTLTEKDGTYYLNGKLLTIERYG